MNCPQCHKALTEGALFCNSCGLSITQTKSEENPRVGSHEETSERDPWLGKIIGGKYELLALLGRGGMGSVYRARRLHIGDEVAVKVLHREYVNEEKTVERFRREAQAAAMLRHPTIVAIYDFGEGSGDEPAFIVMELVEGTTLRKILESEGSLEVQRAVALMREVCKGVAVAHRLNVIHRDIKPDNIMILPPDVDDVRERVKVVDFGIAKLRDMTAAKTLTQTGKVIGTVYYMSPEQCCAEPLDARSDVYSLGTVLYELLAGAPPFTGESATAIVIKHLNHPPPPLSSTLGIAPELEKVLARALAKEPAARQSDASELRKELGAASGAPEVRTTSERKFKDTIGPSHRWAGLSSSAPAVEVETAIERSAVQASNSDPGSTSRPAIGSWLAIALIALLLVVGGFVAIRKPWLHRSTVSPPTTNVSLENPGSWRVERTLATDSKVYALAFSPDDQQLVTASSEAMREDREFISELKFWKASSGELIRTITEHSEGVLAVAFSPDGNTVASGTGSGNSSSKIGKVKLWDAHTGNLKWAVNGHTDFTTAVAFSPDGRTLASASLDHTVKLWDTQTGTVVKSLPQQDKVYAIAFSPAGKILAIAGQKTVGVWDVDAGELKQELSGNTYATVAVAFSPDGRLVAGGDVSGRVTLWDVQTGTLEQTFSDHADVVDALTFSPDGKLLASGGYDLSVIIWDLKTATKLGTLADSDKITAIAFSHNGRTFASGGAGKRVRLWRE